MRGEPALIGSKLGPYEITAKLGAGGMGEVYKARDTRLHREVAVKVLPAAVAGNADRLRRFEQEARSGRYDASRDGQRFLVNTPLPSAASASSEVALIVNWPDLLRKR
jgi:serine/threonine protein kinase